VTDEMQKS